MTTHELEINDANYINFVVEAGVTHARYFGGRTRAGMRVVLMADEMPFAESSLHPVPGRRAHNGGRLYQITAQQAADLREALAQKVSGLEEWSADYLRQGGAIHTPRPKA
jgi:hypothetical protein